MSSTLFLVTFILLNFSEIETKLSSSLESISSREKLLSNENYVNKAPQNIVELDKKKLEEEKAKLKAIIEE